MFVRTPAFPGSRPYNNALSCHSCLLAGGNVLYTPLDSGLRRNDGRVTVRHGKRVVGMAAHLFSLCRHSSESWNPGKALPRCLYAIRSFPVCAVITTP